MNSGLAAVITYGVLTLMWGAVLALYVRHRRHAATDPLLTVLLTVLALDAFKSVVESGYFGLVWAANYGLLDESFKKLGAPAPLTAVKVLNVVVAALVLFRLARVWVPAELKRREDVRLELEANLKRTQDNEETLRLAVSAASDFLWDVDLRTGIISGSEGAGAWLGYSPNEWPPTPWSRIVHEDDREQVERALKAVIKGETRAYGTTHRVRKKDGTVLHVRASGVVSRDANGRAVRFVGAARDVTREVEEDLARSQAQKLESLGLLAGGIAHDFNNLLTVVSSSVETASRTDDAGASRDALQTARLAVTQARALTRQLLAYAGRAPVAFQPIDVNDVVGSMAELLSVTVPRKTKLVRELGRDLPGVKGDVAQLQQVVMNLVTNAAEAIGDREGTVTLRTELVHLTTPPVLRNGHVSGRVVKLTVRDSGKGMSPEVQARIFDPFFTTKGSGRGLGLAALAGILVAHSGGIGLESVPGEGTTVTVYFPALEGPAPSAHQPAIAAHGPKLNLRVLLVDDEPMLRRSAKRVLELLGCTADEAETGRVAVDRVRAEPTKWDVVLMDLTMPELNGTEAAEEILRINPKLPIILSSGYSASFKSPDERHQTLSKPYTFEELEAALRRATEAKS